MSSDLVIADDLAEAIVHLEQPPARIGDGDAEMLFQRLPVAVEAIGRLVRFRDVERGVGRAGARIASPAGASGVLFSARSRAPQPPSRSASTPRHTPL